MSTGSRTTFRNGPGGTVWSITLVSPTLTITRAVDDSKLRPPNTRAPPAAASRLLHADTTASAALRDWLTPAASGVSAHPSPAYQSGRSMRYQSTSLGRVPLRRTGYGAA